MVDFAKPLPKPKLENYWTSFENKGVVVVQAKGASYCPGIIYDLNLPELVDVKADALSSTMERDYPGGKVKAKYLNTFIPLAEAKRLQAMSTDEFTKEFFENAEELLSLFAAHRQHIQRLQQPGWFCVVMLEVGTRNFKAMGHYEAKSLYDACLKTREYSDSVGETRKLDFYEIIPTRLHHMPKPEFQNRTIVGEELVRVMDAIAASSEDDSRWVTLQKGVQL